MANFHVPRPKLRGIRVSPPPNGLVARIASIQPQLPQGIRFLDLSFSAPRRFLIADKPNYGGLYAIMALDTNWSPRPYRPIYIGRAGNLGERVCQSHEKYLSWKLASGGRLLYVAFHRIDNRLLRKMAEERLIKHYKPECNEVYNALAALYGGI